jgi:hypothetical protein
MQEFRATLKNYRRLSDESALPSEFRKGHTALVEPNNAGKGR